MNVKQSEAETQTAKVVILDFHNVLDRYSGDARFSDGPGRASKCWYVLAHFCVISLDISEWTLSTLHSSCIEAAGSKILDLIVIPRALNPKPYPTGTEGKREVIRQLWDVWTWQMRLRAQ